MYTFICKIHTHLHSHPFHTNFATITRLSCTSGHVHSPIQMPIPIPFPSLLCADWTVLEQVAIAAMDCQSHNAAKVGFHSRHSHTVISALRSSRIQKQLGRLGSRFRTNQVFTFSIGTCSKRTHALCTSQPFHPIYRQLLGT